MRSFDKSKCLISAVRIVIGVGEMGLFDKNVGKTDMMVRVGVGVLLLIVAYFLQADMLVRGIIGVVGLVLLVTGLMNRCMLYSLLGINTSKK
jgi:hypothetical protein